MQTEDSPKLIVRLETDTQGKPVFLERDNHRHYKVVFEVENAPSDTYAATFELDPSYYDPVRTLQPESDGKFRLETTAYGDYPLLVRLRRSKGEDLVLKESVARALKRWRPEGETNPALDVALSEIAKN